MATLAEEIRALLQSIGPDLIPQASDLPVLAPQSVQSGSPTPQNVGQTLGPQPGERRNATRGELANEFGQAAGSFAASAADPLGIPSAITGIVSPEMRDSWRQYQGAAGLGPQLAGGLLSGYGAASGLMRGGNALAGTGGMIAGGAATGAGPAIDYAAGAPGASAENAMIGPVMGAAFPVGASIARPAVDMMRSYGLPAAGLAAGGALMASVADAEAQQGKKKQATRPPAPQPQTATGAPIGQPPGVDQYTQTLLANNPTLASRHRDLQTAEQAVAAAEQNYNNNGSTENRRILNDRRRLVGPLREAFDQELTRVTDASRGQNPTFREQFGPVLANNMVRQIGIPFAFGMLGGAGSAARQRYTTGAVNRMVDEGNDALTRGNTALAQRLAADASQTLNPTVSRPRQVWNAMTAAGSYGFPAAIGLEGALAPAQWNQGLPQGHPEQMAAQQYMSSPDAWRDAGIGALFGLTGYKGGRFASTNAMAMIPGGVSPAGRVTSLQTRANQPVAQPPTQAPPVAPPPAPQNLPVDYDMIARSIRPVAQPPTPNPPVPPVMTTNRGATLYQNDVQTNIRHQMATPLLGPGGAITVGALVSRMRREGIMPGVISRAQTAAQAANAMVQGGVPASEVARRITAGEFRNLAVPAGVTAAGAAAHHSATQPRGDDGRFQTPEE